MGDYTPTVFLNMKHIHYTFAFFLLIFISCSTDNDVDEEQVADFDRGAVMENYANNIIIPRYNDFKLSLDNLKSSVDSYVANPTFSTHEEAHNMWLESYKKWQYVEMFNIGKAEEIMFFNSINTYPVNQDRINDNIDNGNYTLSNPNDWSCQGFPGLDYLLHGIGEDIIEINGLFKQQNKYGTYIKVVVSKMIENTNLVLENWTTYKSDFISSTDNTATSDFNMLTNDFVYYFEKGLRTNKVGIPAGVFSNIPLDINIEAYFSSINAIDNVSKDLLIEALNAVKLMFTGTSKSGTSGPSFKSYLDYTKTINNNGVDIGAEIVSKISTAEQKIGELNEDFIYQINTDNTKMLATFDALQTIVVNLKTDMLSLFNVAVDYQDADGD